MKKISKKKLIKALLAPIGKGILIFAVFGMALYAYAITFPGTAPGPVTGVIGQFVGLSDATGYTATTGYSGLNAKCDTGNIIEPVGGTTLTNTGAHVCTADEVINSYNHNSAVVAAQTTGTGIINNGPPGYVVFANDCNGWQVTTNTYQATDAFGTVWSFGNESASLASCGNIYNNTLVKVACCK
ncbi:MAG: hypothetical protein ABH833_00965 [Parcubacteria group bacterium]